MCICVCCRPGIHQDRPSSRNLQLSSFAVISVRVDSLSLWYTNLTIRQLMSFSGGSVSPCRTVVMAVADATRLPPTRSDDSAAAGPPLLIRCATATGAHLFRS